MRCEHARSEHIYNDDGSFKRVKQHRCPDEAMWVHRGHWYCDHHTRNRWEGDLIENLWCPRSTTSGDDPELTIPAWVPETMHARADLLATRIRPPAAPSLFGETT